MVASIISRWYNVPPDPSKNPKGKDKVKASTGSALNGTTGPTSHTQGEETDSQPLDFATYVPTHDASLALPHLPDAGSDYTQYSLAPPQGPMVSQDEAFQRALSAMYWGGYWTAVYHVRQKVSTPKIACTDGEIKYQRQTQASAEQQAAADGDEEGGEEDMEEDVEDGDFVTTQR